MIFGVLRDSLTFWAMALQQGVLLASDGEYVISFNAAQLFTAALDAVFNKARQLNRLQ